jgi:hypothetical protein
MQCPRQALGSGNISYKTSNYLDYPTIYANYLGSPADKAAVIYSYKQLRAIMKADTPQASSAHRTCQTQFQAHVPDAVPKAVLKAVPSAAKRPRVSEGGALALLPRQARGTCSQEP